jgi:hypothetical protein
MESRIFIIEGPSKIGKTSQGFLLSQAIKQNQVFRMDKVLTVEEISVFFDNLESWLLKDPSNKAILTGSIAFTIVNKDMRGEAFGKAYLEYDSQLRRFLEITKQYGYVAFLLKPVKYDFIQKRHSEAFNQVYEDAIYKGLMYFQNYYSNANFKWTEIPVHSYDSILDLQKKIQKLI